MTYPLYNAMITCVAPFGAAWIALTSRHRPLLARFAPLTPVSAGGCIWVHACSVGEINTVRPILAAIHDRWPECSVILSVSTVAGYRHATTALPTTKVTWCPFDLPGVVRTFVERLQPQALLLVETEFWPNMLRECRRRGIPSALLNGRVSDKHFPRYARWRKWLQPVMQQLAAACVQNSEYAERLAFLGVEPSSIHVTGNTKFDAVTTHLDTAPLSQLQRQMGIDSECSVLIFGSTRDGDDALAARCWRELRDACPTLRLIVAPRHIDHLQATVTQFQEPALLRSSVVSGKAPNGERVIIVDTLGELISFYALATVAVVGGSFYPGVNGHNPLEPAALGVPTVFGPYMRNFADPARELVDAGGAIQVASPDLLTDVLRDLLSDASQRAVLASHAREAIQRNQGAIERTLECLAPLLAPPSRQTDVTRS